MEFRVFFASLSCLIVCTLADHHENRIVGGFYANPGQFPYQASVQLNGRHHCGGSIINSTYILTAAHCVFNTSLARNYSVVVGTSDLADVSNPTYKRYDVNKLIPHPSYTPSSLNYDVGLVQTKKKIRTNANVNIIALNSNTIASNVPAVVTGWGKTNYPGDATDRLKYLNVSTISNRRCARRHSSAVTPGTICTMNPAFQGVCFGDSGGPLVTNKTVIGVVSWTVPCGRNAPDGYSRVSYYYNWITTNMS